MPSFNSVAVIGAGAWGTALAGVAARARDAMVDCSMRATRAARARADRGARATNPKLPGVKLDAGITVTDDIAARRAAPTSS